MSTTPQPLAVLDREQWLPAHGKRALLDKVGNWISTALTSPHRSRSIDLSKTHAERKTIARRILQLRARERRFKTAYDIADQRADAARQSLKKAMADLELVSELNQYYDRTIKVMLDASRRLGPAKTPGRPTQKAAHLTPSLRWQAYAYNLQEPIYAAITKATNQTNISRNGQIVAKVLSDALWQIDCQEHAVEAIRELFRERNRNRR